MRLKTTSVAVMLMLALVVGGMTAVAVAQQQEDPQTSPATFAGNITDGDGVGAPVGTEVFAISVDANGDTVDIDSITVEEAGVYAGSDALDDKLRVDIRGADSVEFRIDDPETGAQAAETFDAAQGSDVYDEQDLTITDAEFDIESIDIDLGSTDLEPGDTTEATVTATRADDSTSDVTDSTTITSTNDSVVNVSGSTIEAVDNGTADVEAELRDNTDSVEVTVGVDTEEPPDEDPDGPGPGTGPGTGTGPGPGPGDDDAPPTIEEVRNLLNLVEPTSDTTTQISDADPDTPGVQVRPEGTEIVRGISFDNEEVTGSVNIREYNNPPQEIRSSVSESVSAAGAVERGDVSVLDVVDITPTTETAEESGATVTFTTPTDEVDDPDQLVVVKETFDFEQQEDTWTQLPTTVEEVGEEEITVSAEAESFSLFAVAEIQPDDQAQADDGAEDETADDGADEPDDGGPGTGLIIGLLVVLAVAAAAVYLYSQQE